MNMKKNSGFTLIELLAVIVIIAIIALIATPIVINIINSSKSNANRNSVTFYGKAIDNAVKTYMASNNGKVPSGSYYSKGKMLYLKSDNISKDIGIDYKGNDISCDTVIISEDGEIYITGCKIGNSEEYIYKEGSKTEYFAYGKNNTNYYCKLTKTTKYSHLSIGAEYDCNIDGELKTFNIISKTSNEYNLMYDTNIPINNMDEIIKNKSVNLNDYINWSDRIINLDEAINLFNNYKDIAIKNLDGTVNYGYIVNDFREIKLDYDTYELQVTIINNTELRDESNPYVIYNSNTDSLSDNWNFLGIRPIITVEDAYLTN